MRFELHPHPTTPPDPPFTVFASAERSAAFGATATLNLWFGVSAPAARFRLPEPLDGAPRQDGLWRTTCFELFFKEEGQAAYREWNFSPSGAWAAYDFTATREDMADATVAHPPYLRMEDNLTWWGLGATLSIPAEARFTIGLSAVLEEQDGTLTYWALRHPSDRPDFHHPDCFAARLA